MQSSSTWLPVSKKWTKWFVCHWPQFGCCFIISVGIKRNWWNASMIRIIRRNCFVKHTSSIHSERLNCKVNHPARHSVRCAAQSRRVHRREQLLIRPVWSVAQFDHRMMSLGLNVVIVFVSTVGGNTCESRLWTKASVRRYLVQRNVTF